MRVVAEGVVVPNGREESLEFDFSVEGLSIGILNCDLDESRDTNGGVLISEVIGCCQVINVCSGERVDSLDDFDAFIITGSRAGCSDSFEWMEYLRELIVEISNRGILCLGICFGMQIIADVFGGRVESGVVCEEGFCDVSVTGSLFYGVGSVLRACEFHHDVVSVVPLGARVIALNDCGVQGFELDNFYCVQFHPEISGDVERVMANRDGLDVDKILCGACEGYSLPRAVLRNFERMVCNRVRGCVRECF